MSDAAELREALEIYDRRFVEGKRDAYLVSTMRLADAARTIALPVLEGDAVRQRMLAALLDDSNRTTGQLLDALLAAISTPTPGASE